jgi:hypothetical protein
MFQGIARTLASRRSDKDKRITWEIKKKIDLIIKVYWLEKD